MVPAGTGCYYHYSIIVLYYFVAVFFTTLFGGDTLRNQYDTDSECGTTEFLFFGAKPHGVVISPKYSFLLLL